MGVIYVENASLFTYSDAILAHKPVLKKKRNKMSTQAEFDRHKFGQIRVEIAMIRTVNKILGA
jgi:hypothetical protein